MEEKQKPIKIPVGGTGIDCAEHGLNQIKIVNGEGWCPLCYQQDQFRQKLRQAIKQCHGGGNGRRLLEEVLNDI